MAKKKKKSTGPVKAKQKKKVWGSMQVLASPFAPSMPPASPETRQKVVQVLLEAIPEPFAKRPPRPPRSAGPSHATSSTNPPSCKKPPRLLCGLNEVTRALERGRVELAVVCRDVTPALLVSHIPVLCFSADVRLVVMPGDGTDVGEVFGTRRVLAFALRRQEDADDMASGGVADKLVEGLSPLATPLNFPWLAVAKKGVSVPAFPNPSMVPHRSKMDIG